ncbi:SDR family oxidoreductase [Mitsuaria sp. WAJ17]|uniref:NAD-dependent epimerase/dehydratase family protein n=1 Tax=Mitsuaria sp. WAJ17 TaxID=2761452 RepID=UPI0015FEDFAA|nr:NAD-dependent epimerase/dehydratase family protein [Mitsuaria sp. WAJ17]MBB2483758.1 SDR family oxidoreductase [Mitsuaria sp. WAJ17]
MSTPLLITGASGQIGRWLLHALLRLEPARPLVLALRDPAVQLESLRRWLSGRGIAGPGLARLAAHPYRLEDTASARALVRELRPDTLLHLAARFEWGLDANEARRAQLQATEALWEAQTDPQGHAGRFVALGGYMTQHRPQLDKLGIHVGRPVDWQRIYRRIGGYEASKLETQFHMSALARRLGRPWLCVHPATVCGHSVEGELPAHAALYALCRQLLRGRLQALPGSPRHQLPLVSVDQVAGFLARLALDPQVRSGDFLLMDPASPPVHDLIRKLAGALGVRAPRLALPLAVMQGLLRVPGVAAWSGASAEGLDFLIQDPDFNTGPAEALSQRWGLPPTPLPQALAATARFVARDCARQPPGTRVA